MQVDGFNTTNRDLPNPTADDFCDTHTQLMNWRLLRLFYSPAQRKQTYLNPHEFVKPGLAGLPQPPDDRKET
jgi:hypothetical protein